MCAKRHIVVASNNGDHMPWSLYYYLFAPYIRIYGCCSSRTSRLWWIPYSTQLQLRGLQQHPLLFTTNRTDRMFFLWRLQLPRPSHLITASFCCDRKAWAACAQSVTLWQQATIKITRHDHSIIACSRHIYMGVVLRAHPVRGESHIQRNSNGDVATAATSTLLVRSGILVLDFVLLSETTGNNSTVLFCLLILCPELSSEPSCDFRLPCDQKYCGSCNIQTTWARRHPYQGAENNYCLNLEQGVGNNRISSH